ncbi:hypothetical protein KP509_25G048900 [Ceratopteris richardii]|uniref:F-box domain-containing protein n=1 Tax=Ceratopteris richardii TaxID=49495 RepID=A0A8T2RRG4_CERRI|nr:hypothetical protein KP509_25G048900 [Ceratopteris richardii]
MPHVLFISRPKTAKRKLPCLPEGDKGFVRCFTCPSKRKLSPVSEDKAWIIFCLVFEKLDPDSLARVACVSRSWREMASREHLWKTVCLRAWPSLKSSQGNRLLEGLRDCNGSYMCFYRLRKQAQRQLFRGCLDRSDPVPISISDLFFTIDIDFDGSRILSSVLCNDDLESAFVSPGSFSFEVAIMSTDSPRPTWSKEEMQQFELSLAVTAIGSKRMFQLMDTGAGWRSRCMVVADTCTFTDALPLPTDCCCDLMHCLGPYKTAGGTVRGRNLPCDMQTKIQCDCTREVSTCPSGSTYVYNDFQPKKLCFTMLDTRTWGSLTQSQALHYLHFALFHECKK